MKANLAAKKRKLENKLELLLTSPDDESGLSSDQDLKRKIGSGLVCNRVEQIPQSPQSRGKTNHHNLEEILKAKLAE